MEIRIDLNKSLYENLGELYDEFKKLKRKRENLVKKIEEQKNIVKKKQKSFDPKLTLEFIKKEDSDWFRKFGWSFTTEGSLIIFGKDSEMNEIIVKKYLSDDDIVFHADIQGAGFVILKNNDPSPGEIEQAKYVSAAFSKAWKKGIFSVDVYYVKGEQVSKTPPPGQYLPKGAFMIYGERKYLKNTPVRISFGVNLNEKTFFIGPYEACKKYCSVFWSLMPAGGDYRKLVQDIQKETSLSKKFIETMVAKYLPSTKFRIYKKEHGSSELLPRP